MHYRSFKDNYTRKIIPTTIKQQTTVSATTPPQSETTSTPSPTSGTTISSTTGESTTTSNITLSTTTSAESSGSSTTPTTTTTTPFILSCHECDQFVGCENPEDVGNVTICPETTSHCMVSVNEGSGKVFRRCGQAAETAEQCESSIDLSLNLVRTCFCRTSLCNSENEPTTTTTTTTTSPPLVLVPNGNEIIDSLIDFP